MMVNDEPNFQFISLLRDKKVYSVLAFCRCDGGSCTQESTELPSGDLFASKGGRRIDWRFSSTDDKSVSVVIDGQTFDVTEGALFLISAKDNPAGVERLVIDAGQIQTAGDTLILSELAKANPGIAKFLERTNLTPEERAELLRESIVEDIARDGVKSRFVDLGDGRFALRSLMN